jgi:cyclophilin family peptidyl-prolyl cis-trans isomerase
MPLHAVRWFVVSLLVSVMTSSTLAAQAGATDSSLVRRILTAEDRRDSSSEVFAQAQRSADPRIQLLARRARARIRDAAFTARDSFPPPPASPRYTDPAWRVRFRALATKPVNCSALGVALTDSAWPVRLHAADLANASCAGDSALVQTLRRWASTPTTNSVRVRGGVSWQAAGHAVVALARLAPTEARGLLQAIVNSPVPALRAYGARAAGVLADLPTLRRLVRDPNDNVKEAAIDAAAKLPGHPMDADIIPALSMKGYQAVRAAARALKGSRNGSAVLTSALAAAKRLRSDSSETSRDARGALMGLIAEFTPADRWHVVDSLAADFDCVIADSAARIVRRLAGDSHPLHGRCTPLAERLPTDAPSLALGRDVRLRVVVADSSGGGAFTVRLRGDVAPIMAARVLALAREHWYDGRVWFRVEPDFVIEGGGPGANEYVGHPRFMRDELASLPHLRGTVGMSTRGHDTGDAQWFVNLRDNQRLTKDYTLFGEITDGIDVADGILEGDVIQRIEVVP